MSSHRLIIIDASLLQLTVSGTDADLLFKHYILSHELVTNWYPAKVYKGFRVILKWGLTTAF